MGNLEIRSALDNHWKFTGIDIDKSHEIYRDDVVVEFPQSGERISGKQNIYEPGEITLQYLVLRSFGHEERETSG